VLEHPAHLPGLGHGDEQRAEDLGMTRHRVAQRQARLDVLAHRHDRFLQELALVLLLQQVRARRMLMPEEIIVESWRAKTASSVALTRFMNASSISREECLSAMSRTIRPRCLSWSETACLDSASTSPRAFAPPRSIALKT